MTDMAHDDIHQQALNDTGYWGKQGAGCIIMARDTGRILLPLRSALVLEPLTWGVFGGAVDPNEDLKQSVCREAMEESGIVVERDSMVELYVYQDNSFRYTTFLAFTDTEQEAVLNWESESTRWVEFGDWPSPLHYGLKAILEDSTSMQLIEQYSKEFSTR